MFPPKSFDTRPLINYAEQLLCADEPLMALDLLKKVPAFYRDNYPPELISLRREILAKLATASFYATHEGYELTIKDDDCLKFKDTLRTFLISHDVKRCNDLQETPHIVDMGPGEAALPYILDSENYHFTYSQIYVNRPTYDATKHRWYDKHGCSKEYLENVKPPIIFVATEVIEHLHHEEEIREEMERSVGLADVVHISTPLGAFNPNVENWRDIGFMGHLRTYTSNEFRDTVLKMFPDYSYAHYVSQVQHARLFNPQTKFDFLKVNYEIKT
jgi:hypothetical protein